MRSRSGDTASYPLQEKRRERLIFSTTLKYPSFTSHIQVSKYFQSRFDTCQHSKPPSEYLINFSIFPPEFICQSTTLPLSVLFQGVFCVRALQHYKDCGGFGLPLTISSTSPVFMQTHHQIVNSIPCTRKRQNVLKVQKDGHHEQIPFSLLLSQQMATERTDIEI